MNTYAQKSKNKTRKVKIRNIFILYMTSASYNKMIYSRDSLKTRVILAVLLLVLFIASANSIYLVF